MHRRPALYVVTSMLALATGLALFGTALTIGAPRVSDPRPAATVNVARDFYAAVNETIRTGDPAGLEAVAAADLIISGAVAALAPDRAGLARYLASVHALTPQLDLSVERVVAVQDRAIVDLTVRGADEARFLGSPRHLGPPWGTVESLTVERGRVVEYWSGAPGELLWEPLGQSALAVPAPLHRIVMLDRLLIPPGGVFAARGEEEARLLIGESGSVTVTVARIEVPDPLGAGDLLALPNWNPIEVRNDGLTPASLLVLTAMMPQAEGDPMGSSPSATVAREPDAGPIDWPAGVAHITDDGVVVMPLAGGMMTTLPAEGLVSVGRLTLTSGAGLAPFETGGPHQLVVEQGILGIDAGEGVWIQRGAEGRSSVAGVVRLGTGNGATLDAGTTVVLANPGPAPVVVTIVTILPDEAVVGGALTSG